MSGIAGVVNFDGESIPSDVIERMLDAQAYRGPDGRGVWHRDSVGLGHQLFRTTPEAEYERQPFSLDQIVWITADGRLDNREDLIRVLQHTTPQPLGEVPDCHLMLLAYLRWDDDFLAQLIGDFALAIWDGRNRRLICACDTLANRSLYYTSNGHQFVFGSSIGAVLSVLSNEPRPNESFIAQFLTLSLLDGRTATFYEGVYRLAPAHMLTVENGLIRQTKYYELANGELIHYRNDQEYVDHFRELLEQALCSQLRSNTGVSIQVSGGLDSSSLAVLANHLIATGRIARVHPLSTFCMITPNHPEMDERVYQDAVIERVNQLEHDFFNTESLWGLRALGTDDNFPFQQPEPHPMRAAVLGSFGRILEKGHRVVISGYGSDVINGRINGYSPEGPLRDLSWRDRASEWPYFRRWFSARSLIFRGYVQPVLKPVMRGQLQHARYARAMRLQFPYLNEQWLVHVYRLFAGDQRAFEPELPTRATRLAYSWMMSGWECLWRACSDVSSSFAHVDFRHPYCDRRLIEYMLRVPTRMLIRRGWDKWILREAIGDSLPNPARYRQTNADASALVSKGLREMEKERIIAMLDGSQLAQRGWARDDLWQHAWKRYWDGASDGFMGLVASLGVEVWLRHYFPL